MKRVFSKARSSKQLLAMYATNTKDFYFRIRNRDKADVTVLKFVYMPYVKKDMRLYSPCKKTYDKYCDMCRQNDITALSSWQFKRQMQLMGFVYQTRHRFGRHVTTAYKNLRLVRR